MDAPRVIALGTVVILAVITVASGPLVGLSLPTAQPQSEFDPGSGSFEATVVEVPETATVESARFGADVAHLTVPPVQLNVSRVTGQPVVSYKLRINDFGYAASTAWFLDDSVSGRYDLEFTQKTVDPDRFDRDTYDTTLIVVVRDGAGERVLVERTITTEVRP